MNRPKALLVTAVSLALILALIRFAPVAYTYFNHKYEPGMSPGFRIVGGDLDIPSTPCRYAVRRWGPNAGKPHGPVVSWHANGIVATIGWNVDGSNHGLVETWDDEGRLAVQQRWEHGTCVETRVGPPWLSEQEVRELTPRLPIPLPEPAGGLWPGR